MLPEDQLQVRERRSPACSIIAVTYRNRDDIDAFLAALPAALDDATARVIVVDNASGDGTREAAERHPGVLAIDAGRNLGYAGGINLGRRSAAPGQPVLIANPDLRFTPRSIAVLLERLATTGAGAVVPRLVGPDGAAHRSLRREPSLTREVGEALFGDHWPHRPAWLAEIVRDDARYEYEHDVDWATGAAVLLSPEADAAIGDWDDSFFLYSEEVDAARRCRRAGLPWRYVPTAIAVHVGGGSGSSPDLVALQAVNRARDYARRHGPLASAAHRLVIVIHELLRGRDPARRRAARIVASRAQHRALFQRLGAEPLRS